MGILSVVLDFPTLVEGFEKHIPGQGLDVLQAMDAVATLTFWFGLILGLASFFLMLQIYAFVRSMRDPVND